MIPRGKEESGVKIRLRVTEARRPALEAALAEKGIQLDEDADLVLTERNRYMEVMTLRDGRARCRVAVEDIVFIESFGKEIVVHGRAGVYRADERLKELEMLLDPERFLRISHSVIVSRESIRRIEPAFSAKFILTLDGGAEVVVTRSYYDIFREALGI